MIVLDTSVLSLVFRRAAAATTHPAVRQFRRLVDDDAGLAVPGIVFQELLSGVKNPEDFKRLEEALSGFPLLLADRVAHRRAAMVRNACRSAGIAAASFDCLIAAQALIADAELFTLDADFVHVARATRLKLTRISQ